MRYSVVIPTYNGKKFLSQCLNSLFKAINSQSEILNPKPALEIIVVDNNSTDGSQEYLRNVGFRDIASRKRDYRRKKPRREQSLSLRVILNKKNLGFAAAVNQGIKTAQSDYVVVMNNDLRIEKDWFLVMEKAIKKFPPKEKKIAAYFGTVLNWDGSKIESTGLEYWLRGKAKNRNNGEKVSGSRYQDKTESRNPKPETHHYLESQFIWGASASMVIYYRPALIEVGLFDEDFFAYEEDVDLILRLRGRGWKTLYLPKAISYHLGGGTSQKMGNFRQRMDVKNWWFIIIKNYPLSVLLLRGPEIFIERLRNLSGLLKATPFWRWPLAVVRTYGEILLKLPRMIKKRKPVEEIKDLN